MDLKIIKEYNDAIALYESKNELMFYNEEGERIYLNVYNLAKFCCECYRIIIKSFGAFDALDGIYYALYNVGGKDAWVNVFMLGIGEYRYDEDCFRYMKVGNFNDAMYFLNQFGDNDNLGIRCSKRGSEWIFGVISGDVTNCQACGKKNLD